MRICCSRRSILLLAERPVILNLSGNWSTTLNVCVPMEPVEPSIEIFRTIKSLIIIIIAKYKKEANPTKKFTLQALKERSRFFTEIY